MRRPLLIAALVAATIPALGAHAATTPKPTVVITDPAGDARYGDDITGVSYSTTKKNGALDKLVVTVTFVAAPKTGPLTSINVQAQMSGCGLFWIETYWSVPEAKAVTANFGDCAPDVTPEVTVVDKSYVYTFSAKALGAKAGTTFGEHASWTTVAEPLVGIGPGDLDSSLALDDSAGATVYKVK